MAQMDNAFSRLVRSRDNNTCQRCRKVFDPDLLDNSHFFRRNKFSTRYMAENCDTACNWPYGGCHAIWEVQKHDGGEYRDWKMAQLGPERFAALEELSQKRMKLTDAVDEFQEKVFYGTLF